MMFQLLLVLFTLSTVLGVEEGSDYYGHDIRSYNSADLTKEDCKQYCEDTEQCTRWMFIEGYTEGRNYCWLKNIGANTRTDYGGAGKAFSAPVLREEEEIGVAWHGAASVFIDYDPYTKARCIQDCKRWKECAHWTWESKITIYRNRCMLSSSTEEPKKMIQGAISGSVFHDEEVGIDFNGNDFKFYDRVSKYSCRTECKNNQQCKAFTFVAKGVEEGTVLRVGLGKCWLKNKVGPGTEYRGEGVAYSAKISHAVCEDADPNECFRRRGKCYHWFHQALLKPICQKTCGYCYSY